jgi:hypothetical protein
LVPIETGEAIHKHVLCDHAIASWPHDYRKVMENCREILPTQSLPIAYVDGDNLLLLRVDAKKFGQIYLYVDCESAAATKGIHRVAKTFGEFLKGLQYTDPAELDDDDYGLW